MFVLEDLWLGNISPSEREVRRGSTFEKLSKRSNEIESEIRGYLPEEWKERFEECCAVGNELLNIGETDAFVKGFRLGARMILDVVGEYKSQLPQIGGASS